MARHAREAVVPGRLILLVLGALLVALTVWAALGEIPAASRPTLEPAVTSSAR
jgi:hypothetical protein